MKELYLTFRSVTYAQRGQRILEQGGIRCILRRTPRFLAKGGCGYCLVIRQGDGDRAVALLLQGGNPPQGRFMPGQEGML